MNIGENVDFSQLSAFADAWQHLQEMASAIDQNTIGKTYHASPEGIAPSGWEAFLGAFQCLLHTPEEVNAPSLTEAKEKCTEQTWLHDFSGFVDAWKLCQPQEAECGIRELPTEAPVQKIASLSASDLQKFLDAFAAELPKPEKSVPAIPVTDPVPDLCRFLAQWQALNLTGPLVVSRKTVPELDGAALVSFASAFAPLRQQALHDGAFLNVWEIAGLNHSELRIVSVLRWLLDAQETHGLGTVVSQAVLQLIRDKARAATEGGYTSNLLAALRCDTACHARSEVCPFDEQEDRIDLHLDAPDFELFIEAKVDATQGEGQLHRYHTKIRDLARLRAKSVWGIVYLTRHGQIPDDAQNLPNLTPLSWHEIASAIRQALQGREKLAAALAFQYADYIQSL